MLQDVPEFQNSGRSLAMPDARIQLPQEQPARM
jgi:hypothetical protein